MPIYMCGGSNRIGEAVRENICKDARGRLLRTHSVSSSGFSFQEVSVQETKRVFCATDA